ncbi:MAG: DUF937 domain-containing protein [Bacteroidota bacterium]
MSLIDQLSQQLSGPALQALSQQIGADEQSTQNAITAALPMMMNQMAKQTEGGNAAGIMSMIDKDGDGNIMDDLVGFLGTTENGPAAGILSNLFGGNQSNIENGIGKMSGLDNKQSNQLLSNLAPIVMGFLSNQKQQGGLDISGLTNLLVNEKNNINQQAQNNPLMDMASKFLDADGDGSVLDDLMNMAGGGGQQKKGGLGGLIGGLFGKK